MKTTQKTKKKIKPNVNKINGDVEICVRGDSCKLLNRLYDRNIVIKKYQIDNENIKLKISTHDYNANKTAFAGYNASIIKTSFLCNLGKNIFKNIGFIIGGIIGIIILIIASNMTINIDVQGLKNTEYDTVVQSLKNVGICKYKMRNVDRAKVEKYLLDNIDTLSMVSVKYEGSTVQISVTEKEVVGGEYLPIVADTNMYIVSIVVTSGTANVSSGSIVRRGEVLIYPYVIINDNQVAVEPHGEIEAQVYYSATEDVKLSYTEFERTGKKTVVSRFLFWGLDKEREFNKYANFDIQENVVSVGGLRIKRTTYYETTGKEVKIEWDAIRDEVVARVANTARASAPSGANAVYCVPIIDIRKDSVNVCVSIYCEVVYKY